MPNQDRRYVCSFPGFLYILVTFFPLVDVESVSVFVLLNALVLCCYSFYTVCPCFTSSIQLRHGTKWGHLNGRVTTSEERLDLFVGEAIIQVKIHLYYLLVNHCPGKHWYIFSCRPSSLYFLLLQQLDVF